MPPAPVPETALKKRRRDEEWAAARSQAAAEARAKRAASRADAFKRAESYVKEYRAQVRFFDFESEFCF
jgi:large subunit ribosomal protein L7e